MEYHFFPKYKEKKREKKEINKSNFSIVQFELKYALFADITPNIVCSDITTDGRTDGRTVS